MLKPIRLGSVYRLYVVFDTARCWNAWVNAPWVGMADDGGPKCWRFARRLRDEKPGDHIAVKTRWWRRR